MTQRVAPSSATETADTGAPAVATIPSGPRTSSGGSAASAASRGNSASSRTEAPAQL